MKDGKQQTGAKDTVKALPCANIAVLSYCVVILVTGESDSLLLFKPLIFNRLRRSSVQVGLYIFAITEIARCFGK